MSEIPSREQREMVERQLLSMGWSCEDVAKALQCSTATIRADVKGFGGVRSLRVKEEYKKIPSERHKQAWRTIADPSTPEDMREHLKRMVCFEEACAAFAAAVRVCFAITKPDLSALPEWQAGLLVKVFKPRADEAIHAEGHFWSDLLVAIRMEQIALVDDARANAETIAEWVEYRMNVRKCVRPRIGREWIAVINTIFAEHIEKERDRAMLMDCFGGEKFAVVGRRFKLSGQAVRQAEAKACEVLAEPLRELGDLLHPYATAIGQHRRILELEQELAGTKLAFDHSMPFNRHMTDCIEELETLSLRTKNCLYWAGIKYIWQATEKSEEELLKIKNFGKKCLNELKALLTEYGLTLGMTYTDEQCQNLSRMTHYSP